MSRMTLCKWVFHDDERECVDVKVSFRELRDPYSRNLHLNTPHNQIIPRARPQDQAFDPLPVSLCN